MGRLRRAFPPAAGLLVAAPALLTAGCTADPAPAGVTVAWADGTHRAVRVTWTENGEAPNRISIAGVVTEAPGRVEYTRADAPNLVTIPASAFPTDGNYQVAVSVGTAAGGSTSKPGLSPMFDTDGPVRPVVTAVRAGRGGSMVVRWKPVAAPEDFTPADPLDLPPNRQTFAPAVGTVGAPMRVVGPASTATHRVLTGVRPPYLFQLRAVNEWGVIWAAQVASGTTVLSAQFPRLSTYGGPMPVRGRLVQRRLNCLGERPCVSQVATEAGRPVVLHARGATRWFAVGRALTRDGGYFSMRVTSSGSRHYRVVAPTTSRATVALLGSRTAVAVSRTRPRLLAAGFAGGGVKRTGQPVTVVVRVAPAVTKWALLQYWTGRVWQPAVWVPVRAGQGSLTFRASRPGVRGYRFVLPATWHGRSRLAGFTTPSLVLLTR